MKGKYTLVIIVIAVLVFGSMAFADDPLPLQRTQVRPERLQRPSRSVDLNMFGMVANPCMCMNDMKNYHKAISPKNMHVRVYNPSSLIINAKVTLKYYSLSRSPGTWKTFTRNITIQPNRSAKAKFWSNTYYDIISVKNTRKVETKVEIISPSIPTITDPNMENNVFVTQKCEYIID